MDEPQLFHFAISHYNEKVRWALDFKGWPHRRYALVPGLHIPRARAVSGQNRVPILVLDGKAWIDSPRILEEVERRRPDPPLFPRDASSRARCDALQTYFDEEVAPELRRLFWACYLPHPRLATSMATAGCSTAVRLAWRAAFPLAKRAFAGNLGLAPALIDKARARLPRHLDRLAAEVGPRGYLVGDGFGVADLCAASIMSAILRPPQFPYPLAEPWPERLIALRASIVDHAASKWVLRMYAAHRGVNAAIGEGSTNGASIAQGAP